jgi:hypothetical protein
MKKLILMSLMAVSCAAPMAEQRMYNPDGSPAPLASEMAEGTRICAQMCAGEHRPILRYQTDGKCVCDADPRASMPREDRRSIPKYVPDNET